MKPRVVICASGNLGFTTLLKLQNDFVICGIITDVNSKDIIDWAVLNNKAYFKGNPRKNKLFFKNNIFPAFDFLLSINYLYIIDNDLITLPKKMAINIHGGLLPRYRGRAPHIWAIINGESECGITVHKIDEGCDTGDIIIQKTIPILPNYTGGELLKIFESEYPFLIFKAVELVENGHKLIMQDHSIASYFPKRTPEDGEIDWNWSNERINNWVRALTKPYPGAFSLLNDIKFFIWKVEFFPYPDDDLIKPGQVKKCNDTILVKTGNGIIKIIDYSFEGEFLDKINNFKGKKNE